MPANPGGSAELMSQRARGYLCSGVLKRQATSRERLLGDGRSQRSNSLSNQNFQAKLSLQITRDPVLDSSTGHGFTLTTNTPLLVRDIAPGSPADGILYPGDHVLQINDTVLEDLSAEQVENVLRDLEDCITVTILRHMTNPKSSIMSAEKRARLRSNPVKVRFAEEVVVNGHTQGNSLLFLPNVLKVYLENGQTKAFKFDNTTTVKDIVLTLKDKLSIRAIEYFALVLEQQYSITKLLLLHEDEFIQKVVQKKDSHDYRCLFRVCFIPRDPVDMMQEDSSSFEYFFMQSVGDVLQERFAVEMKCNTALRLAALHMHERLDSCGQTRASIKNITKEFGLDSFISPTLLSNMREKDLRKAISYHLKKIQSLLEPRQKVISANQARLAYLTQLGELISYGGRSYTATMMLQDREVLVSLLVGAKYGMSQVINHKLNVISRLVEFSSISRVELLSESDKVSLLRISLHDMKPFALLMDSLAAKDLGCLLGGYCKLLVDPCVNVFRLGRPKVRVHRIPAEEDAELADRKNANRLSGNWNGLPAVQGKEPSSPLANKAQSTKTKSELKKLKDSKNQLNNQQPSPPKPSEKPEVKVKPPLAPKPQLPPKPQIIPPKSPQHGRSYAHCNGDTSGRLSSELLEMEPDTMEFKSVTSGAGGLPLSSPLITAVRCSKQQLPITTPQTEEKMKRQENSPKKNKDLTHENGGHVLSKDKTYILDEQEALKVEGKSNGTALPTKKPPNLPPIPRSNSGTKLAIPPPVPPKPTSPTSLHPLSLPTSSPVSPTDPDKGIFKDSISPPNGIHPWSSRNGSVQSGPRRVSLSHESLSPKNTDAPLTLTTSLISTTSKGVGGLEGREPGRSGSGSDLRTSSSSLGGRLPASALRGKIQALPWYMTRSQEILGTLDYPSTSSINGDTSGFGSGLSVASGLSDLNKTPIKDKEIVTSKSEGKGNILDDGAEVVIATIKEAQEVTSHMKNTSGTNGSHLNLSFKENSAHSGSVSSEQPQSRAHSAVGLGGVSSMQIGGDSPTSSLADSTPPQQHREACGCRTVYANCFSGDTEDGVSFDEELTVYEFSRRTRPKPARPPPIPSPTTPSPNPNILSLLRDNPRPLSTFSTASSELSPLVSRPGSPTTSLGGPLRSLTNKNYGGLKGGFASLRQDIDQLLLVLERGALEQPQQTSCQDGAGIKVGPDLNHNRSEGSMTANLGPNCTGTWDPTAMTEAERSLLQSEARRLASGCQRATRVGWAPDEALRSLSNSFSALVQLSAACLRTNPCPGCDICHNPSLVHGDEDDDSVEAMGKLKEIVGLYREFVGAVETAGTGAGVGGKSVGLTGSGQSQGESDGVRLLAKRCTVLISSVFALTQLFRTRTLDTPDTPVNIPLNF
ncbi:FERM and PDZ domain-containing protein 1 [Scomber scombrus]|uniref:FERM and PDZ domain-containing protein 1 n=1 Tax=Scomber scombrus TaxID=13677 RepID=A0AAV1NCM9_SCOSC